MKVKQLSVFVENKSGRLASVIKTVSDASLNIRALSLADTADFGILRLIVNNPDAGLTALKESGFAVTVTEVIAVAIPDSPGGLTAVLDTLNKRNIDIEYMYAFVGQAAGQAVVVLRVESVEEAIATLTQSGIAVLKGSDVYA